ncbi:MAG: hypothetical protein M3444_02045 [Acidobacteriota bacterium]|nr:hypothetical protein [Acidobacteriota bacterium]
MTTTRNATALPPAGTRKNLVENSGFEIDHDHDNWPDSWVIPHDFCFWDAETKLGSGHSLRLQNTDAAQFPLIYQTIPCQPDREYTFSAWIKGENVSLTNANGAGMFIAFADAQGKNIGGQYPPGFKGTFDWSVVSGKVAIPAGAAAVHVGLYLSQGNTGTAWFDELVVAGVMHVFITQPAYRRTVVAPARASWQAEVNRSGMINWRTRIAVLYGRVLNAQGKVVMEGRLVFKAGEVAKSLELAPPANLPVGDYRWQFSLWNAVETKKLDEAEYGVRVEAAGSPPPTVHLDADLRTIVDGEPFFPLGFYIAEDPQVSGLLDMHLKYIADSGFNTVLSYTFGAWGWSAANSLGTAPSDFLQTVNKYGLRAIYSLAAFHEGAASFYSTFPNATESDLELATDYVNALRGNKALLGWYLTDEPPSSLTQKLQDMYQLIRELDREHPCYQVHTLDPLNRDSHGIQLANFYDSTDVIGVDPYSVPHYPLRIAGEWTQDARLAMRGAKPAWVVIGIADGSIYSGKPCDSQDQPPDCGREPSLAEKRCTAYLALIYGAQGLLFYSYFDIFLTTNGELLPPDSEIVLRRLDEVAQLGQEFSSLTPLLLTGTPLQMSTTATKTPVRWRVLQLGASPHMLIANPSRAGAETIRFRLPKGDWASATVNHGDLDPTLVKLVKIGKYRFLQVTIGVASSGEIILNPA